MLCFQEQIAKSALYFANVDEHVDFPRPISHKVIYIGGFGESQSKPLDEVISYFFRRHFFQKFENIMQKSTKGVVLISFGTVALSHNMPQDIKNIFLETFRKFPDVTFLWKYEKDEHNISVGIPNLYTRKWLPQNDILGMLFFHFLNKC